MILALKTNEDPTEIYLLADDFEIARKENAKNPCETSAKVFEKNLKNSRNLRNENLQFGEILARKIWKAERNLARDLLAEIEKLILKTCENFDENLREKLEYREKNSAEKSEKTEKNFAENSEKINEKIDGKFAENLCEIDENFAKNPREKTAFSQISAIIIFRGPGSFTGLRIGISVANVLAYARNISIVGAENSKNRENWREEGLKKLSQGKNDGIVLPKYGAAPNITKPKK